MSKHSPQKGLEIPWGWGGGGGGGGSQRPKTSRKCMQLNSDFQRVLMKNPFHRGGMEISDHFRRFLKIFKMLSVIKRMFPNISEPFQKFLKASEDCPGRCLI